MARPIQRLVYPPELARHVKADVPTTTTGRGLLRQEISAFRLGMPPEVLRNIKTTVVPMMGNDDTAADALDRYSGYPWVWQETCASTLLRAGYCPR